MRSTRGLAGSVVLVAGVGLAFASAVMFNAGASEIIHFALGLGFVLLASAAFDFRTPSPVNWLACVAMGLLAAIFLMQGTADLLALPDLSSFAYGALGQTLEKLLGYVFVAWCAAVLLRDSAGWTRALGVAAIAAVIAVDAYDFAMKAQGSTAPEALKLLDLLLFAWLILESSKPRTERRSIKSRAS